LLVEISIRIVVVKRREGVVEGWKKRVGREGATGAYISSVVGPYVGWDSTTSRKHCSAEWYWVHVG
jgi:hypothetical protein